MVKFIVCSCCCCKGVCTEDAESPQLKVLLETNGETFTHDIL